jgi:AcrR family transcriptional regulator
VATLRTDARRNRQTVLKAAQAAFAADGVRVPLAEIARRAGVGAGTVHRHFPSKRDLVEAVLLAGIERLVSDAGRLATADDPGTAFFEFFSRAVEQIALNKALCDAFEADLGRRLHPAPAAHQAFRDALGDLLRRAQIAGAVRADLDAADVTALVAGCVTMERGRDRPGRTGRMTALVSEVLRPGGVADQPAATSVTKQRPIGDGRNETGSQPPVRDETPSRGGNISCEVCGGQVRVPSTGRRARFCSSACRQKAHRERHRSHG